MIHVLIGDIFQSKAQTIVNTVNCVGVMGKGVAAEFKKRYPAMYTDYKNRCTVSQVKLGELYYYTDIFGASIVNFPTKNHWRSPSKLSDIVHGLDYFISHYQEWGIKSIALPPLGCGNGGLEWSLVGPIMYQKLSELKIPVEIYAPYGTKQSQLTIDFLSQKVTNEEIKGKQQQKLNPAWLAILEVVEQLSSQPYAYPIGRTIFQKIAYILTEQGVETKFNFKQGSYGPFAQELNEAIKVFSNNNLIEEKTLGRMTAIHVGSAYSSAKEKNQDIIKTYEKRIAKAVDLFSRIKNTEQAEEITTVLFAARKLKKSKDDLEVTEQDLYNFILKWKKNWNEEHKKIAIADTIRNLEMLGWVRLQYSTSLFTE